MVHLRIIIMAIHYIDFNGGNDANDGSSFANRKKTFHGLISDHDRGSNSTQTSLIGDEFRVKETPIVNTGVNATWTSGGVDDYNADGSANTTKYISTVSGGSPIQVTTNGTHDFVTGDVVAVYNVKGVNSAIGTWIVTVVDSTNFTLNNSNGYGDTFVAWGSNPRCFKVTHKAIKVNTACKGLFQSSGTSSTSDNAYNNSNNLMGVVTSPNTLSRNSWIGAMTNVRLQINNSFGTGKAWYYTLPETMDLSDYQRISMEFHNRNDADASTSHISFKLCTDTTGDTPVHSFSIPGYHSNGRYAVVHDFGTNLNSAIKSIALYIDTDVGAEDLRFHNIIALKDSNDAISHKDVIGKNTTAEPVWWNMHHINPDHMIFGESQNTSGNVYGFITDAKVATYCGTSETVALYKITPFDPNQFGVDYNLDEYRKYWVRPRMDTRSYLAANPNNLTLKLSGGWNSTDMSTRTGVTWLYLGTISAVFFTNSYNQNMQNFQIENFGFNCSPTGMQIYGGLATVKNVYKAGYSQGYLGVVNSYRGKRDFTIDGCYEAGVQNVGFQTSGQQGGSGMNTRNILLKDWHVYGGGSGCHMAQSAESGLQIEDATIRGWYYPLRTSSNHRGVTYVKNLDLKGAYSFYSSTPVTVQNATVSRLISEYTPDSTSGYGNHYANEYALGNYNGNANDNRLYVPAGCIKTETTVRHSTGGVAWKIQPKIEYSGSNIGLPLWNVDRNPLAIGIANVFCQANKAVTVTAYLRRTSTDLTTRLAVRTRRYTNFFVLASDVTAASSGSADTWEQVTLTFTPTGSGLVGIDFEAFGGNSHTGYVDTISITQAT